MIEVLEFIEKLNDLNVNFYTGVPDSLLKEFLLGLEGLSNNQHIIATNEGSAVALAIGYHLATKKTPLVYMQNSGLGNAINPLVSLTDKAVYQIPMILMIGWRGEISIDKIQKSDEPQHIKQGQITLKQLDIANIPYMVIDQNISNLDFLNKICTDAKSRSGPIALVIRKNVFFLKNDRAYNFGKKWRMLREEALKVVLSALPEDLPIVSTTGMSSRELLELKKNHNPSIFNNFYTIGGMGHASQIAAGIALFRTDKKVICIDGDGSILMHTGALAISSTCKNIIHILINNGSHDSVGGQPTKAQVINLSKIASGFGYSHIARAKSYEDIKINLDNFLKLKGSCFLEILCKPGSRKNLMRPEEEPYKMKNKFISFLSKS